jgi:hypothetical protein
LQINCFFVSQSTFDLGEFPFALHITQASTASATAFLRFSQPPLADYAVCERIVQQNFSSRHPFLSFSMDTTDEVRKKVESAKIRNAKTIQTNTV